MWSQRNPPRPSQRDLAPNQRDSRGRRFAKTAVLVCIREKSKQECPSSRGSGAGGAEKGGSRELACEAGARRDHKGPLSDRVGTVGRTGWAHANKPEGCEGRRRCRRCVRQMRGRGLNTTVVCLQSICWDGNRVPGAQGVSVLPLKCVSAAGIAETGKEGTPPCSLPSLQPFAPEACL